MNTFKNILYVVNDTSKTDPLIEQIIPFAERNDSKLTMIMLISDHDEKSIADARHELESLPGACDTSLQIQIDVLTGTLFLEVIRAVIKNGYDLVIKRAENPGFLKRLFGSDDMHLLRKCPCPLCLLKPGSKLHFNTILAAVDFDPKKGSEFEATFNTGILDFAASLALNSAGTLHIIHVWEPFFESVLRSRGDATDDQVSSYIGQDRSFHQNSLKALMQKLEDHIGTHLYRQLLPVFHIIEGNPQKLIAEKAHELKADIVVMGTVARTGISGLIIGNTAEATLNQLSCSVLAVKPPGFVSPVTIDGS